MMGEIQRAVASLAGLVLAVAAASCGGGRGGAGAAQDASTGSKQDASTGSSTSTSTGCTTDADCLSRLPATTPPGCATASCNALQGQCVFSAKDEDGDGHPAHACVSNDPGVAIVSGDDCNDHDPNLYPGHPEPCSTSADGGTPVGALCVQGQIRCEPEGTESTCTGTVSCVSSACVSGSCAGSCTPGSTQCSGNGVQTCDAMGSWGSATSCGATATCVSTGASMAQCAGSCASGSTTCGGDNGVQTCTSSGTWGDAVACVNSTCVDGSCLGTCAPLQTSCSDNAVLTCAMRGAWGTPLPCGNQTCVGTQASAGGDTDAAVTTDAGSSGVQTASCMGVCAQYAVACDGQQPRACDATGQWQDMGSACDATHTCVNGSCTGACGPTQTRCDGQQSEVCDPTGQWQDDGNVCGSSQTCSGGVGSDGGAAASCQGSCSPGQVTCNGVQPQVCGGTGLWQDSGAPCSGGTPACHHGTCVVCDPGAGGCAGPQPQVCNSSGTAWQSSGPTCAGTSSPICLGGACVPCSPGATQCGTATQPQTCDPTGHWQNETGCVDQTCAGGGAGGDAGVATCQGQCAAGQTQCVTSTQPQTCDATGTWQDGGACVNQTCVGGGAAGAASCQGVCAPGPTNCIGPQPVACGSNGQWENNAAACSGTTPFCVAPGTCSATPASCRTSGAGLTNCGSSSESCCVSLEVTGGTYYRTYNTSQSTSGPPAGGWPDLADPATISTFRLDKYPVTVGRFRQFVAAWSGGWTPPAGSGKHGHLNGGLGLADSGNAGSYEPGWQTSANASIAPTNKNLTSCGTTYDTWTAAAGSQENLPINCVNWSEAYAFCIWDGGFLPSEAEWEYAAAGGSQQREFAWGSTVPGKTCPGTGCQYTIYGCYYPSGSGSCTGLTNIATVGTATLGAGQWGQLDLSGEIFQWVLDEDSYRSYVDPCTDCSYLTGASDRVLRGDYFSDATLSDFLPPNRYADDPGDRFWGDGLRCARTP